MSGPEAGSGAHLERNLALLARLLPPEEYGHLASRLPSSNLTIESAGNATPTARYKGRLLYSRHDPLGEARRLIEREVRANGGPCLFEGFGLGYHVEAFLELCPDRSAVVVEPDLAIFVAALGARDLSKLLASKRLRLLLEVEPDALPMVLDGIEPGELSVVRLRPLEEKDHGYFARIDAAVAAFYARAEINRNTLTRFGRLWVRNLVHNLRLVERLPGISRLVGLFDGLPALLLAAGPSLDELLPHLPELARRSLVIAVDTSLRAALGAGVVPDFLVVVDPQYWNSRHLDWCGAPEAANGTRPVLISESSTYPAVFRAVGEAAFLCSSLFPLGAYLEERLGKKGLLGAGGSVSTTAWDFARIIGCRPLNIAGLDLGFPGGKTHFRGSFFEERAHTLSRRTGPGEGHSFHALHDAGPYYELNQEGGRTLTDRRLIIYKWWFENQLKIHPSTDTRSFSREGIRIEGMRATSIDELLARPVVRDEIETRMSSVRSMKNDPDEAERLPEILQALSGELEELCADAREGLRLTGKLKERLAKRQSPQRELDRLEALDGRILGAGPRHIVGFLLQNAAEEIMAEPASRGNPSLLLDRSERLYRELAVSAVYHLELIARAGKRIVAEQNCISKG